MEGVFSSANVAPPHTVRQHRENARNCSEQGATHVRQENVRRAMLMGSFATSDGKMKSAFNKSKWLSLCQLPFRISNQCCTVMKKSPLAIYQRRTKRYPILATMACESRMRQQAWIRTGCNAFEGNHISSKPMSFWTEQDVLQYIKTFELPIAAVYGDIVPVCNTCTDEILQLSFDGMAEELDKPCELCTTGANRTGCIWCGFGAHLEKGADRRFLRLKQTHPQLYDYCMRGGNWFDNPDYIEGLPEYDGEWKNWNPQKIWMPDKGLGYAKMIDMINETYGYEMIAY